MTSTKLQASYKLQNVAGLHMFAKISPCTKERGVTVQHQNKQNHQSKSADVFRSIQRKILSKQLCHY